MNLPHELTPQQREFLVKDFVREALTRGSGRVVDVNIHDAPDHGDERNIHAHILITTRAIGPEGFEAKKLSDITPEQIEQWREKWAHMGARALERAGFKLEAERYREAHLDLERQSQAARERGDLAHAETLENRQPAEHLGPAASALERRGEETALGNAEREITDRDENARDELRALKQERAEIQKRIEATERIEELDRLIFATLLEQAIRQPERLDEEQLLAWKMPTAFTTEFNETIAAIQEAQSRNLDLHDIDKLISEREMHADKALLAEIDLAAPTLGPLAFAGLQQQQEEHEREIARRDPVILAALLGQAIRHPERLDEAQLLAWKMPTAFTTEFNETIASIQEAQALNLDLSGIDKLIADRKAQARALDRGDWKREGDELIAEGQRRQAAEQERAASARVQDQNKTGKPEAGDREKEGLGRAAAEIRLARTLTGSPQEFAEALEDRGYILARVTAQDIQKDRERKKEQAQKREPQSWMEHEGGYDALNEGLQASARRSYEAWDNGEKKKQLSLEKYVSYVQKKWREDAERSILERAPGQLAVVSEYGNIHILTARNTGLQDRHEIENYVKGIDRAPLMTVNEAREAMADIRRHRYYETRMPEWEKHWPTTPPETEPIKTSPRYHFEDAAREAGNAQPDSPALENPHGTAAHIRAAYRQSDSARAFAAALNERGISLAAVTKEESDRSRRQADFAREIGHYAPAYREGEIVAVSAGAYVFKLNQRTAGEDPAKVERFLKPLDRSQLQGIDATKRMMLDRPDRPPEVNHGIAAYIERQFEATSAQTREGVQMREDRQAFADAIDERHILFAVVTEGESKVSIFKATCERISGEYAPRYAPGEIVAVTGPPLLYRNKDGEITKSHRVHRMDQTLAAEALQRLRIDRSELKGIAATERLSDELAQERRAERFEKATEINQRARKMVGNTDHGFRPGRAAGKLMESAMKPIGALFSLIDPPKTPAQLRKEAIKAHIDRETQAERNADLSNFLADRAQERKNEQERKAARDRERGDRER